MTLPSNGKLKQFDSASRSQIWHRRSETFKRTLSANQASLVSCTIGSSSSTQDPSSVWLTASRPPRCAARCPILAIPWPEFPSVAHHCPLSNRATIAHGCPSRTTLSVRISAWVALACFSTLVKASRNILVRFNTLRVVSATAVSISCTFQTN